MRLAGKSVIFGIAVWLVSLERLPAATVAEIYSFPANASPVAPLAVGNDGALYGTTVGGGNWGNGSVFRLTTNGTLTTLASFNHTNGDAPKAGLVLANDGLFYGMTELGGERNSGTVFRISTNGVLTTLLSFNGTNGAYPIAALTQGSDGALYGTAPEGGTNGGSGVVFRLTTNGVIKTIVSFALASTGAYPSTAWCRAMMAPFMARFPGTGRATMRSCTS